jgi:hypothetical protein
MCTTCFVSAKFLESQGSLKTAQTVLAAKTEVGTKSQLL